MEKLRNNLMISARLNTEKIWNVIAQLNLIFAILGISAGLYLIYSSAIRTISRKIEVEFGKMEEGLLSKLDGKTI